MQRTCARSAAQKGIPQKINVAYVAQAANANRWADKEQMMSMPIQINMVDGKVQAVSMWHPINGKWVLITQIIGEQHEFYTDGVKVDIPSAQQSVHLTRRSVAQKRLHPKQK